MSKIQELFSLVGEKRLRASYSASDLSVDGVPRVAIVDEQEGTLYGVQICLEGEARGHGVWLGSDFIDDLCTQGSARNVGMKVRFGHPNMCSDALGTFLGRASNFRCDEVTRKNGDKAKALFADIKLADEAKRSPSGDLYTWTLEAAKNNPDTFGQSIVFTYKDFYVVNKDGEKKLYSEIKWSESKDSQTRYVENKKIYDDWLASSVDGRTYAVLDKFLGTDFTDSPAATDGVFTDKSLAATATEMLDDHPEIVALLAEKPDVVAQFVERYNSALEAAGKPRIQLSAVTGENADWEKRFSGMQSAKDKTIGDCTAKITELTAALDAANATVEETKAAYENLSGELATLKGNLDTAEAALSVANGDKATLETTLADTRKQLEKAEERYAMHVSGAMAHTPLGGACASWKEAAEKYGYAEARRKCPDLYNAFMESNKKG